MNAVHAWEGISFSIREASLDDIDGIARVKKAAWAEEQVRPDLIAQVLQAQDHTTFVAEAQGQIVAFVDSFSTRVSVQQRWEIDLLAVEPGSRGKHLGEALVRASCRIGFEHNVQLCRALIQVENTASQKTFYRCGFRTDDHICQLLVCREARDAADPQAHVAVLLPVTTMNYRGLWLESNFSQADLAQADLAQADLAQADLAQADLLAGQAALRKADYELVGAVISTKFCASCQAASRLGYLLVGEYQWWTLTNTESNREGLNRT